MPVCLAKNVAFLRVDARGELKSLKLRGWIPDPAENDNVSLG